MQEYVDAESDDSYDDGRYQRKSPGKKRTTLKNRKGYRPSGYTPPKPKKEVFPPVSEMVIESIKALKDHPK